MISDEIFMRRCLEIARFGLGAVAPNPMVGCVIVHDDHIIGEGFHKKYGEAHAEVNAINSVCAHDFSILRDSTLYVNLEPCSHHGKTPPCSDLILLHKIPKVIIGCIDSNRKVSGKGIEKLENNGCKVLSGVLEKESRNLNKRFFTFHEKKRPYIILKWAQTQDGFIARIEKGKGIKSQVSNLRSQELVQKWRSEEQAIMIGTNTAMADNPLLTVRHRAGKDPLRIVIDKSLRLGQGLHLFDQKKATLIFTSQKKRSVTNLEYSEVDFSKNPIPEILSQLHQREIQSVIVEGGSCLLNSFLQYGEWDEARIFYSKKIFSEGVKAPDVNLKPASKEKIGEDDLITIFNI